MSEEIRFHVNEDGDITREDGGDAEVKQCNTCKRKSTACVSFLSHENAMMHKDVDNERAHRTTLFVCITFIIITTIFVTAYTLRMNTFVDLIKSMYAALVDIANAKGIIAP